MGSAMHIQQDLVPANSIKHLMVLACYSILIFMWEQHHVATSAFKWNRCFQMWAKKCQSRVEQFFCWAVCQVGNRDRISKDTVGGWTLAGSPVKLPSDWDEPKRWRIVCSWVEGEEAKPIQHKSLAEIGRTPQIFSLFASHLRGKLHSAASS